MNRFHFPAIIAFLVFVPAAFASGEKSQAKKAWPVVSVERTIPWQEGKENPALSVSYELPDFDEKTGLGNSLRTWLYGGMTAKDYAEREIAHDKAEYDAALREFDQEDVERSATMNWEFSEKVSEVIRTPKLVVFERMLSSYTGGAHGNYSSEYFVVDTGEMEILDLSDILSRGSMPKLLDLAEARLRKQYEIADGEPLSSGGFFEDTLAETKDFALDSDGLVLRWGLYAIAPYVMGEISVTVPYDEIRGFLTPRGKDLVESIEENAQ
jgi:hypothetical protein